MHIALKGANLTASDIDEILLVGGSTRTPVISQRLFAEFRKEPQRNIDPDLCVALGAAVQAGMIAGESVSAVLVDVTPYTYGTSAMSDLDGATYLYCFVPIIRKNTPLPVTRTEVFYTLRDGQVSVEVKIFQGEDRDALNNIEIGEFTVNGLRDVPAGNPVTLTLSLDLDGILHVSAREKETGLEKSITINNAIGRFEGEAKEAARDRVARLLGQTLKEDAGDADVEQEAHHEEIKAVALVEKAERMLDQAAEEDRMDMVELITNIREAIADKDSPSLAEASERLADILYYLEN